jgi:hypothetical protein
MEAMTATVVPTNEVTWSDGERTGRQKRFSLRISRRSGIDTLILISEFFYLLDDLSSFVFEFLSVERVLAFLASDGVVEGSPPPRATKLITVEVVPKQ